MDSVPNGKVHAFGPDKDEPIGVSISGPKGGVTFENGSDFTVLCTIWAQGEETSFFLDLVELTQEMGVRFLGAE